MRLFAKTKSIVSVFVLAAMTVIAAGGHAHAQSLSIPANIDWIDGASACTGTVNGVQPYYYYAVAGDTAVINMKNLSSTASLDIQISESGHSTYTTTLAPLGTASTSFPVTSEISLEANGDVCTSGHGGPANLFVEAARGSLVCSMQNNQIWTVTPNLTGTANTVTLYRDSSFVYQYSGINNGILTTSLQFAAQTSAATYYAYNGSSSSASLIARTTCPAKTVAAPKTTAGNASPNAPATTTTTPAAPATTSQQAATTNAKPVISSNPAPTASQVKPMTLTRRVEHVLFPWLLPAIVIAGGVAFTIWRFGLKPRQLSKKTKS